MSAIEAETFHMPFVAYRMKKQQQQRQQRQQLQKISLPRRRILKCALFSGKATL